VHDPWDVVVTGDVDHPGGVLQRFSLPALDGGDRVEGPDGRPTLFTFVGPDCSTCRQHLEAIDAYAKGHPDLRVVAVSSWDPRGDNDRLLRSLDLRDVEIGVDPLGRMATAMYGNVQPDLSPPTPYSVLISPDGTIVGSVDGVWSDQAAATLGVA
jgi:thiol-disulfide isomerase/thioredoxin